MQDMAPDSAIAFDIQFKTDAFANTATAIVSVALPLSLGTTVADRAERFLELARPRLTDLALALGGNALCTCDDCTARRNAESAVRAPSPPATPGDPDTCPCPVCVARREGRPAPSLAEKLAYLSRRGPLKLDGLIGPPAPEPASEPAPAPDPDITLPATVANAIQRFSEGLALDLDPDARTTLIIAYGSALIDSLKWT